MLFKLLDMLPSRWQWRVAQASHDTRVDNRVMTPQLLVRPPEEYKEAKPNLIREERDERDERCSLPNSTVSNSAGSDLPAVAAPTISAQLQCSYCANGGRRLKNCSKCMAAQYCNDICSMAHWKEHRSVCKQMQRPAAMAGISAANDGPAAMAGILRSSSVSLVRGVVLRGEVAEPTKFILLDLPTRSTLSNLKTFSAEDLMASLHPSTAAARTGESRWTSQACWIACPVPALLGLPLAMKLSDNSHGNSPQSDSEPFVRLLIDPVSGFAPLHILAKRDGLGAVLLARMDEVDFTVQDWKNLDAYIYEKLLSKSCFEGSEADERKRKKALTPAAYQCFLRAREAAV